MGKSNVAYFGEVFCNILYIYPVGGKHFRSGSEDLPCSKQFERLEDLMVVFKRTRMCFRTSRHVGRFGEVLKLSPTTKLLTVS